MVSLKYDWEHEYVSAILETDNARLPDRTSSAELAMTSRLDVLKDVLKMDHAGAREELSAIATALGGLEKLRLERLGEGRYSAL
jgi:hypothetical protein